MNARSNVHTWMARKIVQKCVSLFLYVATMIVHCAVRTTQLRCALVGRNATEFSAKNFTRYSYSVGMFDLSLKSITNV